MLAEKALYAKLSGTAAVTALVGSRIVPAYEVLDNAALPLVSYEALHSAPHVGAGADDPRVTETRLRVTCVATSYSVAKDLADKVRSAIHRMTGTLGGVAVQDAVVETSNDDFERELNRAWVEIDVMIWVNT